MLQRSRRSFHRTTVLRRAAESDVRWGVHARATCKRHALPSSSAVSTTSVISCRGYTPVISNRPPRHQALVRNPVQWTLSANCYSLYFILKQLTVSGNDITNQMFKRHLKRMVLVWRFVTSLTTYQKVCTVGVYVYQRGRVLIFFNPFVCVQL